MTYSVSTHKGEENGIFLGDDLEGLKKIIAFVGHTIKEIKETKLEIQNSQESEYEINNSWRTS